MTELEQLIKLINSLPTLALWVLICFWAYKVLIVGSVYGLIRFIADRLYQAWKAKLEAKRIQIEKFVDIENYLLSGTKADFMVQLERMMRSSGHFIHGSDVEKIKKALDLYDEWEAKLVAEKATEENVRANMESMNAK